MKAPSEQIPQVNRAIVGDLGDKLKIIGVEGPMYRQQTLPHAALRNQKSRSQYRPNGSWDAVLGDENCSW